MEKNRENNEVFFAFYTIYVRLKSNRQTMQTFITSELLYCFRMQEIRLFWNFYVRC